MSNPFNADNFDGSREQIEKLNSAYALATEKWFDGADPENLDKIKQLRTSLCDRIGNAFNDELDATEIAFWATQK